MMTLDGSRAFGVTPALWDYAMAELGRRGWDVTDVRLCGVPMNLLTAARYPCHDRDLIRDLLAKWRAELPFSPKSEGNADA